MKEFKDFIFEKLRKVVVDGNEIFKVKNLTYQQFLRLTKNLEGLVFLGAGGSINEWITGITKLLQTEKLAMKGEPEDIWRGAYLLTTSGGRKDLVLLWDDKKEALNMGKLPIWRIKFGDVSWISDYKVNFEVDFNI